MDSPESDLQEMLDALDPQTRTLVAEIDLGAQAKEFMHSDLGRHLVGCLNQEVILAQEALAQTPFWMFWRVQSLQNRIWRAKFIFSWMRELLIGGRSAQSALDTGE